jgi:uncharacterized membrane protein YkvI
MNMGRSRIMLSVAVFITPVNIAIWCHFMHEPRVMLRSQNFSAGWQAKSHWKDPIRLYETTNIIVAYIAFSAFCGKDRRKRTKIDSLLDMIERP